LNEKVMQIWDGTDDDDNNNNNNNPIGVMATNKLKKRVQLNIGMSCMSNIHKNA
jgi:hypothetical protein